MGSFWLTFFALEDAMNEAAWCYLEGFGCKKDKVSKTFPAPVLLIASLFWKATALPREQQLYVGGCQTCA